MGGIMFPIAGICNGWFCCSLPDVGEIMKKTLDLILFIMIGFVLGLIGMAIGWMVMGVCLPA
jgi:hypothetical protein